MKVYKFGVNETEYLSCNKCGKTISGEIAYLILTDIPDEFTDVYCEKCKNELNIY